jgi:transcriptional regulator with XRE-family HTH domain
MKGQELRAIRKRLKITQAKLAELLGVTANTVARWERDEMGIREPMARLIQTIYAAEKNRGKDKR